MLSLPTVTLECQPTAAEGENTEFCTRSFAYSNYETNGSTFLCTNVYKTRTTNQHGCKCIMCHSPSRPTLHMFFFNYLVLHDFQYHYEVQSLYFEFEFWSCGQACLHFHVTSCAVRMSAECRTLLQSQNCQNSYRCGHFC
jgi:hypothetical protein